MTTADDTPAVPTSTAEAAAALANLLVSDGYVQAGDIIRALLAERDALEGERDEARAEAEVAVAGRGYRQLLARSQASEARAVRAERERDEALGDRDEYRGLLHDLVLLEAERWALNGGGPGWAGRWEAAMRRATERFDP